MEILYFASAPAPKARRALDFLLSRFPTASISIALCPDLAPLLTDAERQRIVFRAGTGQARLAFVWRAWRARHDVVAVLFGGDANYLSMKLTALVLRPRQFILCINESNDAFEWRLRNWRIMIQHAAWRFGSAGTAGPVNALGQLALHACQLLIGEPLGLVLLTLRTVGVLVQRSLKSIARA